MTGTVAVEAWRPGTADDRAVAGLLLDYHRQTEREKGSPVETAADLPPGYRAEVDNPAAAFTGSTVLLARAASGTAVGCLVLTAAGPGAVLPEVKRLWVDPAARGSGVATVLLDAGTALAREHGARGVRLSVWDWRDGAIRLYEQAGFRRVTSWDERDHLVCLERVDEQARG